MPQQVYFSSAEDMIRYVRQFGAHYIDLPTKFHTNQKNIDAYASMPILYSCICIQLATNVQICIVLVILFILQKSTDFVQFSIT